MKKHTPTPKTLKLSKQTIVELTQQSITLAHGADSGNSGCYSWCDTCPPCGSFTCQKKKVM
jgi:hypothetical protein